MLIQTRNFYFIFQIFDVANFKLAIAQKKI